MDLLCFHDFEKKKEASQQELQIIKYVNNGKIATKDQDRNTAAIYEKQ